MLLSQLPDDPIEQPAPDSWAWGRHPKNGFGYKARHEGQIFLFFKISFNENLYKI